MTALVLIDVQLGLQETDFYGEERSNPEAEKNCSRLLAEFRSRNLPLFHVQHCSTNPESPLHPTKKGNAFHHSVQPMDNEPIVQKNVNSAFIGTDLESKLKAEGITHVIIAGLTTEHCVSTSTRMASNLGFETILISDATASFNKIGIDGEPISAKTVHQIALANLKDEFATIKDTTTLLQELDN